MCREQSPANPPFDLRDSSLWILRSVEHFLTAPEFQDALYEGTAGCTTQQVNEWLHEIDILLMDLVSGRLAAVLSAAEANEPELLAATEEMKHELEGLRDIAAFLNKVTQFLEILKKIAGKHA
jgi:hypothetical protein